MVFETCCKLVNKNVRYTIDEIIRHNDNINIAHEQRRQTTNM